VLSEAVSGTLNRVLLAVTVISLIVSGMVLMNLMLLSVTERRREIGLRRALGGRRRDILLQFMFESLALTSGGGVLGVLWDRRRSGHGRMTPARASCPGSRWLWELACRSSSGWCSGCCRRAAPPGFIRRRLAVAGNTPCDGPGS